MWNRLSRPWQACVEEAWAAYGAGSFPIGAVIADATGQVLTRGRNRTFDTIAEDGYLSGTRLAHAEVNALLPLDKLGIDPERCILYTTAEPCPLCAGAIRMARVCTIQYASHDPPAGSSGLLTSTPFFRKRPISIIGPQDHAFEDAMVALRAERAYRVGGAAAQWVLESLYAELPRGAHLGERLGATGYLQQLWQRGITAGSMLDELARLLKEYA